MKYWTAFVKRFASDKKALLLAAVFVIGVLLFALSGTGGGSSEKKSDNAYARISAMESELEQRAVKLLSGVKGVGRVRVLVTLDRLEEAVYAENRTCGADGRSETDYVIVEKNGEKTGLTVYVSAPAVRGVAVSCEGGGSARVRQEVVELLSAAFGIGAARIRVSELEK